MDERSHLDGRCGSCARFVRVVESIDTNGEVRRSGQCLLGVWSPPLYETNTCSQYVKRGTFTPRGADGEKRRRQSGAVRPARGPRNVHPAGGGLAHGARQPLAIPEELLDMDADEFRDVLREVIRDELGIGDVTLGARWQGGEVVLRPGKEGTADKTIPIEALFRKVVAIRDKLRVLEQKVNSHPKLTDEDKVQLQAYVTQCYGTLTTFNVLFADRADHFVGQKGDKDD